MTIGAGIAIAAIWIGTAALVVGYQKVSSGNQMSPFGAFIMAIVALFATYAILGTKL